MDNLGPNLPVNARPSLALVDTCITGILFNCPKVIHFWISSSTPFTKLFRSIFRATIKHFDFLFYNIVVRVRLHSFSPETINFLAFCGLFTFFIACLYAKRLISRKLIYYNDQFGTLVTHYRKVISLYCFPANFPIFIYSIYLI